MTTPSTALQELFDQHEALRVSIAACEGLADEIDRGRGDMARMDKLVREVAKLRIAFAAHNRFEEHVLRPILREIDSFGDARIEQMYAGHVAEHRALFQSLDEPTAELRATLDQLRAHLAAEERYFLSARVLRDDVVTVESSS